jgi:hypothetical protein
VRPLARLQALACEVAHVLVAVLGEAEQARLDLLRVRVRARARARVRVRVRVRVGARVVGASRA